MQHPACQDQLVDAAKHVAKSVDIVVETAQVSTDKGHTTEHLEHCVTKTHTCVHKHRRHCQYNI